MWVIFGKLRDFCLNDLLERLSTALPALLSRALSRARRNFKLTTRWSPQAKPVRRRSCQKHKNLHSPQTRVVQYSRVEWISFEHLPHLYLEKLLPSPISAWTYRGGIDLLVCEFPKQKPKTYSRAPKTMPSSDLFNIQMRRATTAGWKNHDEMSRQRARWTKSAADDDAELLIRKNSENPMLEAVDCN